jgi:hypothetical protein
MGWAVLGNSNQYRNTNFSRLPDNFTNAAHYLFHIVFDFVIGKTQHPYFQPLNRFLPNPVFFSDFRPVVDSAIDFNCQSKLRAIEIQYIGPDAELPSEFCPLDLSFAQEFPKCAFRGGCTVAQLLAAWSHGFTVEI